MLEFTPEMSVSSELKVSAADFDKQAATAGMRFA